MSFFVSSWLFLLLLQTLEARRKPKSRHLDSCRRCPNRLWCWPRARCQRPTLLVLQGPVARVMGETDLPAQGHTDAVRGSEGGTTQAYGGHVAGVLVRLLREYGREEDNGRGRISGRHRCYVRTCQGGGRGAARPQIQGFRGSSSWDGAAGGTGSRDAGRPGWNIGLDKQTACQKIKTASTSAFPSLSGCHIANWQLVGPPSQCETATALPRGRCAASCARAPSQRLRGVEHFSVQPCTSPSLIHESPARVEPVSGSSLTIHGGEGLALPLQRDDVTRMVGASEPCRRTHQAPAASPSQPIAANRSQSPAPFSGGHPAAQHRVVGREAEALASKTPVIVCYMTIPRCPYQMYSPPRGWFRAKRTAYQQSQTQASGSSGGGKPRAKGQISRESTGLRVPDSQLQSSRRQRGELCKPRYGSFWECLHPGRQAPRFP